MKLQGFTIIFALIAIPLILVLAYYIQLQVDTITLQNEYDSKLLDATYDAMSSFEINTANEDLSSVSDSLRTIIEASNNVFFNTLATNLGMSNASKSNIEPYIPAMLYTLYDGYYISTPTQVPKALTDSDGNAVSVGDKGVSISGSLYKYEEPPKDGSSTSTILSYDDVKDLDPTDWGQLLYYKKGTNENDPEFTTDINNAEKETDNVLKTYMPYSARYKNKDNEDKKFDLTVIYTLDNYVTIEGYIEDVYYTKSGYLIPKDSVKIEPEVLKSFNQNDAEEYIKQGNSVKIKITTKETSYDPNQSPKELTTEIESSSDKTYSELNEELTRLKNQLKNIEDQKVDTTVTKSIDQIESEMQTIQSQINDVQYKLNCMSSVIYYVKAEIFSNWVYDTLHNDTGTNSIDLKESNLVAISNQSYSAIQGNEQVIHNFSDSDTPVFETGNGTNKKGVTEIPEDSSFYTHKLNVIRNSIQYNLNIAMTTYNNQSSGTFNYEMPVIQNSEWEQILSKVSFVSFMQGYNCGLKTYNNYKIVSSTNNELTVDTSNIYYVKKSEFSNTTSEYHRIDCPKLVDDVTANDEYISFSSKEVKYDKIYNKQRKSQLYEYDHKNLACYICVNDGNYDKVSFDTLIKKANENNTDKDRYTKIFLAYYMSIGKERNDIYKMNAVDNSEGYEVIYNKNNNIQKDSSLPISKIKSIEIVIGTIKTLNTKEQLRFDYEIADKEIADNFITPNAISSNDSNFTTIKINLEPNTFKEITNTLSLDKIKATIKPDISSTIYVNNRTDKDNDTQENLSRKAFKNAIQYIKVIYK